MIEWILGAAVIGGIGSLLGDNKSSSRTNAKLKTSHSNNKPAPPPSIDANSDFSEWRSDWEPAVDWDNWLPKERAAEIIRAFPPYENGASADAPIATQKTDILLSALAQSRLKRCEESLLLEFATHNEKLLKDKKEKYAEFFAFVERNPLTNEQMDCCICMDSALQIVAAAGSGKTSTIVARVGYALGSGFITRT